MQIARALPHTRYFGSFIAQQPSVSLRMRSDEEIVRMAARLAPGEVVGAHLHYSEPISRALAEMNALHLLIIRDPAEVLLSEVHYLSSMNRFHRMAREFERLADDERIDLALGGASKLAERYPPFADRIAPYAGWLDDPDVCLVRYEEFSKPDRARAACRRIVEAWAKRKPEAVDIDHLAAKAANAVAPEKSHTKSNRKSTPCDLRILAHPQIIAARAAMNYRDGVYEEE